MEKYSGKVIELKNFKSDSQYKALESKHEYECCVLCGKQVDVRRDTHVDFRAYYVVGCGQLCRKCFISIYKAEGSITF
jgi:hypothetical protein